jgi:hypothetical protein
MAYNTNTGSIMVWLGYDPNSFLLEGAPGHLSLTMIDGSLAPTEAYIELQHLLWSKSAAISANQAEARRRIYAKYPIETQLSIQHGLYPELADQCVTDIAAVIQAENAAAALIEAATTVAEVEAVQTPVWPS